MQALTGHYYALDLVLSGTLSVSSDWIPSPLSRRYPADVVSVSPARKDASGWMRAEAVIRWRGDPGLIEEGDQISSDLEGVTMGPLGLGASAEVVRVTDLGLKIISTGATLTNYAIAAGLLGFTVWASMRVRRATHEAA